MTVDTGWSRPNRIRQCLGKHHAGFYTYVTAEGTYEIDKLPNRKWVVRYERGEEYLTEHVAIDCRTLLDACRVVAGHILNLRRDGAR